MLDLLSLGDAGWGDEMLRGAAMTVAVALGAFSAGLVFGSLAASAKLAGNFAVAALADLYTTVLRGVPELLVIYLLFFGGSNTIMMMARLFGYDGYVELNAFTIGVIAVGMVSGAYATEVIRGAVLAVPYGQIEAAKALGMGRWLLLRRVLVPQALRF
ncbi:MAG TPA: ABC transporter permease subunit, partial [Azospirillaceae bacterium]|nr:ABC transporter permease subunit [Azospirillaceae bacterium]